MADSTDVPDDLSGLAAEIEAMMGSMQAAQQAMAALAEQQAARDDQEAAADERHYPAYIDPDSDSVSRMRSLLSRFQSWLSAEGAADLLQLRSSGASPRAVHQLREELAQGDDEFELPESYLSLLSLHDGQSFDSVTGLLGRWFLLDARSSFAEWRDQNDMMNMGLYAAPQYERARKGLPRHPRIDTSSWFNPRWLPIACSRGVNLGGDLICLDLAAPLSRHRGQVILYQSESAERILLADSLEAWLERIVDDLHAGVYRFDRDRRTWVAGRVRADDEEGQRKQAAVEVEEAAQAAERADSSSSSSPPAASAASRVIGVEAFLYSSLERREFFIQNRTEELVFLPDNDFGLLSVSEDMTRKPHGEGRGSA